MAMFCLKCSYLPTNLVNIPFKSTFRLSRLSDNNKSSRKNLDLYALLFKHLYLGLHLI